MKKSKYDNLWNEYKDSCRSFDIDGLFHVIEENKPITDLDTQIHDQPHYTEEYYKTPRVVWGKEQSTKEGCYSDRMWEWDYNKAKKAQEDANSSKAKFHTARWYQKFLSSYFDRNIKLKVIMAGYNLATGYPYQYFGFD